jgi:radical SAM superfamily enzyme YgiQ (UPF0313 family)
MLDLSRKRYRLRIVIPAFPGFNIYSNIANKTTALGPVCIASAAHQLEKWDVEVIDENNLGAYGPRSEAGGADHAELERLRPADVVGLYGGLTSTVPRLYEVARFYRKKGVITVAGGQHFIEENIAEALDSGVDVVVINEGEETIQELLRVLETRTDLNQVRGLAYKNRGEIVHTEKREPLADFDQFPLPDFSLVRYANIQIYPIERIRGCGMNCEFCTVKNRPRCAAPERFLEQVRILLESRNARHFFIVDDLFGQDREETIRLCGMLEDYQKTVGKRLDFTAQIRLDKARDQALLNAMRRAGINMVAIGYESPIAEELTAMNKQVRPQDMITSTRLFQKAGFLVHGMFIFGYPLQEGVPFSMTAQERVKRFRDFIRQSRIDTVQILLPVPLPGTELRHRLERQRRVYTKQYVGWEYYDGNFPVFEPDQPMSAEEMLYSVKRIMGQFYQFKYMFAIGANILSFPMLIFFLHNIRKGWLKWYRPWRNSLVRFFGSFVVKGWTADFKKGSFLQRLKNAQDRLNTHKDGAR